MSDWPADKVDRRAVAELIPYARNARTHSPEQVAQLAASIREWGWTMPVLIDEAGGIIAGHGRVLAAQKLGIAEVPCMVATGWSEAQKRAYVIADNKLTLNAGWDLDALRVELQEIQASTFDELLTGFTADEFAALTVDDTEISEDADDIPDPPVNPVTKAGDIWVLGNNRLLCGDSTDRSSALQIIEGKRANICITDPPYGIGDTKSKKNKYDLHDDSLENLLELIDGFFPITKSIADVIIITPGVQNVFKYPSSDWLMAWFTPAGVGSGPWGFCCWQPILCYGKDPKLSNGMGRHPDAIVHTESSENFGHPCAKPINFWCWLVDRTTRKDDVIYDPFCGSGTTIIAAEKLGRTCLAIEISPVYCDIIVTRWQNFTGKQATRESDDMLFDEIAASRNPDQPVHRAEKRLNR